ncbi:MAG: nickel transporter permease [Dehalococcoidia bacterium]
MAHSAQALTLTGTRRSGWIRTGRKIAARSKVGVVSLAIVAGIAFVAIFAPLLAPADPLEQDYNALLSAPSAAHPLGTDQLGRDLLSRIMFGARISLLVGVIAVGVAMLIGVPLGLLSGYARGVTDEVIMRVMDALIAFPSIILALAIVAVLQPSLINVMIAIGITSVPLYARLMRSQVLSLREREYIAAARAIGATDGRIMARHILPNSLSPIIVQATLGLGFAVLAEAGLSYLGVGVQPPTPTWGSILNQGAPLLEQAPWLSIFPGLAIFILVLAFNLLGDALRDQLDPRLRGT